MTELPNGWRQIALADLGTWYGGGTPSKSRSDFWSDGTVPWLSPKDMGPEVIRSTQDRITEAAVGGSAVRRVPAGSVALVVRSGILERTIPIAVVPMEVTLNQDMKAVVPWPDVDARWVAWGLRSREQALLRQCRKAGTTVASIETKRLLAQELPLPPIDEQRRIVEILEDHLSRLDAASHLLATARKRLERWELASLWAATHCASGILRRVDAIADVKLGRQRSPANHSGDRMRPYLRAGNVHWNRLRLDDVKEMNFTESEEATFRLAHGDILVVEASGSAAEVGKSAIYHGHPTEVCFQNTLLRVRCRDADPAYVQKYLLAEAMAGKLVAESRGVGIHHIGRARLASLEVSVPDHQEQSRRATDAESVLESGTRLRQAIEVQLGRVAALRRALLAAAFSGRLT